MELETLRKELEKLDMSLEYIVLLRLSLSILIGKTKLEQHLAVYQPEREKKIYDSLKWFSDHTGVDSDLLASIYKQIMLQSVKIQENLEKYDIHSVKTDAKSAKRALNLARQNIGGFLTQMNLIENMLNYDNEQDDILGIISKLYEDLLS